MKYEKLKDDQNPYPLFIWYILNSRNNEPLFIELMNLTHMRSIIYPLELVTSPVQCFLNPRGLIVFSSHINVDYLKKIERHNKWLRREDHLGHNLYLLCIR